MNLSSNDHPQYQLGSEKDTVGGYAGLTGGVVNKPIRAIRLVSPDPSSPGPSPGDAWINGLDFKYQNNNGGTPATETIERRARIDNAGGYAGLDGDGHVNKAIKAIRLVSPDPTSPGPSPGDTWVNGVDLKFRNNNGGGAQTETVERQARRDTANGYAGLDGGGRVADIHAPAKTAYTSGSQALSPGDIGAEPAISALPVSKGGTGATTSGGALANLGAVAKGGDTMAGDIAMAGHKVTGLPTGTDSGDAATYGQLVSMVHGLDWQDSVKQADLSAIPTSPAPSSGDRFLVAAGGSSDSWNGHYKHIALLNPDATWTFIVPNKGTTIHVDGGSVSPGADLTYDGANWVNIGASVDHNQTLNLTTGNPHTQYQLGSEKDTTGGYAGLDGGGRIPGAHAPAKAVYATGGGQALVPADIGAPPSGRAVAAGPGLNGGGDLSADLTLYIAAFTGVVSKDVDPASQSYPPGVTTFPGASCDVGADGTLLPMHIRLPAVVDNTKLNTEVVLTFSDTSTVVLVNTDNGSPADLDMVSIADKLMGGLGGSAMNNGKRLQQITAQVNNITGSSFTADISWFRVRAYAMPRGDGGAL